MVMHRLPVFLLLLAGLGLLATGCTENNLLAPESTEFAAEDFGSDVFTSHARANENTANENACWGQASRAFAQMGEMGEHSSSFPTPRLGLRNLARALYDEGVLPDDSMQSLGAFVARTLGLSIDACL
jgi:hypothetical protein